MRLEGFRASYRPPRTPVHSRRCRIKAQRLIRDARARSRIDVGSDNSQGSPGLKGSSLPAGTLSSAMLSTMASVT